MTCPTCPEGSWTTWGNPNPAVTRASKVWGKGDERRREHPTFISIMNSRRKYIEEFLSISLYPPIHFFIILGLIEAVAILISLAMT
jgi:hypothetical protein